MLLHCCRVNLEKMAAELVSASSADKCFKLLSCLKCCKKDEEDGEVYTSTNVNLMFVCCGGSTRGHDTFKNEHINHAISDKKAKRGKIDKLERKIETQV